MWPTQPLQNSAFDFGERQIRPHVFVLNASHHRRKCSAAWNFECMKNGFFFFYTKSSRYRTDKVPERDEIQLSIPVPFPSPTSSFSGFSEVFLWSQVSSAWPFSDLRWQLLWARRVGSGLAVACVASPHSQLQNKPQALLPWWQDVFASDQN